MKNEYYIPSSVILAFIETCQIHKLNPYSLLAERGITPNKAKTNKRDFKVQDLAMLLDRACTAFGSYSFAITFAKQYEWYKFDEKILVLSKQDDLHTLTLIFNALLTQQSAGPELLLTQMGNIATYRIKLPTFGDIDMTPYSLVMIAIWDDVMSQVMGADWSPDKFNISGVANHLLTEHIKISDLPVFFDSKTTSIEFNAKLIHRKLSFDISRRDNLIKTYSQLLDVMPIDVLSAELLKMVISSGNTSIEHISLMIGTSPRLLQKKLKGLNTNFSSILSNVRINIAKELLLNTSYSVSEIAYHLAFKSSETFVRFFKLNESITPLQWRKNK
ncbi:helix-turn-helix transcriptional regulator [Colwellia sp. 12G3]|uniref:helix-turn-helix transcriptional regulator n=1 Tax=Colwellia sp. 12G3 TaxID=2058299 RepID=UPI000C345AB9|nr:helix-turn-helix transcriptional regulator [Colwellia sp. 12G3]PKI17105.1 hypothetical protein CXF71_07690 [Colwellia sp. 12G3]